MEHRGFRRRLFFLLVLLILAACQGTADTNEKSFSPPNRSTPVQTVRTFWWAIENGREDVAQAAVDEEQVAQGRHGVKLEEFLQQHKDIDSSDFEYIVSGSKVTIRSAAHTMDYELEETESGQWVIVSIHP